MISWRSIHLADIPIDWGAHRQLWSNTVRRVSIWGFTAYFEGHVRALGRFRWGSGPSPAHWAPKCLKLIQPNTQDIHRWWEWNTKIVAWRGPKVQPAVLSLTILRLLYFEQTVVWEHTGLNEYFFSRRLTGNRDSMHAVSGRFGESQTTRRNYLPRS